jgi:hypothetical protein
MLGLGADDVFVYASWLFPLIADALQDAVLTSFVCPLQRRNVISVIIDCHAHTSWQPDVIVHACRYFDAMRQSELHPDQCESLQTRMQYTVHRSAKAALVTSLTTAAACLATSMSRVVPIAAFGIFACLCIVCLFAVNTLLMPPALIAWERNFASLPFGVCCSWCPCINVDQVRLCWRHACAAQLGCSQDGCRRSVFASLIELAACNPA